MANKKSKAIDLDLILFDNQSELEILTELECVDNLVISFDYESHKFLEKNNIKHTISDSFLTKKELQEIQQKSYQLVRWYEIDHISQILNYENINLGETIRVELNYFLVPILKKIGEMKKIIEKYPDRKIVCGKSLEDIAKIFKKNVKTIGESKTNKEFYYDKITVSTKIAGFSISLKLTKNKFLFIKNFSEKITQLIFAPKKIHNKTKTVLFVEFDPIRYKEFFLKSRDSNLNCLMYNRRRPTIWNMESFNVVRKSGCKIITEERISKNNLEENIHNNKKIILEKIESIKALENIFVEFFSIYENSFWHIIKEQFYELLKKRAIENTKEIMLIRKVFENYKFSSILIGSEIGSTEQIITKLAKNQNIPITILQHGLFFDDQSEGSHNMNKFQGVFPNVADKIIVWGEIEKNHQIRSEVPKDKVLDLGSPYHDKMNKSIHNSREDYILLATSGPVKENTFDLTVETIQKNIDTIKKICQVVTKLNKKLIIKIHPSPDEYDPTELALEINDEIKVVKSGDISKLIQSCEVFIVIDISTVMLDAQILNKPVISVQVKDSGYGIPSILETKSCIISNIHNIEADLKEIVNSKNLKEKIIHNGKNYVRKYFSNLGGASEKIFEYLEKY